MGYQPSVAKYKIEKDNNFCIIYDVSNIGIMRIIGTTHTFWGAKRLMKKYIQKKNKETKEYYFTQNGELINE